MENKFLFTMILRNFINNYDRYYFLYQISLLYTFKKLSMNLIRVHMTELASINIVTLQI